jgi:hypothetical protein
MLEINIPGGRKLQLKHMVLDYNGTIAFDGDLIEGLKENLEALADKLQIHILTADTFGKARPGQCPYLVGTGLFVAGQSGPISYQKRSSERHTQRFMD